MKELTDVFNVNYSQSVCRADANRLAAQIRVFLDLHQEQISTDMKISLNQAMVEVSAFVKKNTM